MSGGSRKNITTIEQMEAEAKNEDDGACYKRIRGEWLEVMLTDEGFVYTWGKNKVSRNVATNIIKSAAAVPEAVARQFSRSVK